MMSASAKKRLTPLMVVWRAKESTMAETEYKGRCFCGAVELTVTGKPAAMGYCHCTSCREWSAGPVNAFTLWEPTAVKITKGEDQLGTYNKTPTSARKWCKTCGGHVFTDHPPLKLVDVYAATIPDLPFKAEVHVNYGETVLKIKDGLPKQKDFPAEMGGSGTLLPE
jgi:hypothetical protein